MKPWPKDRPPTRRRYREFLLAIFATEPIPEYGAAYDDELEDTRCKKLYSGCAWHRLRPGSLDRLYYCPVRLHGQIFIYYLPAMMLHGLYGDPESPLGGHVGASLRDPESRGELLHESKGLTQNQRLAVALFLYYSCLLQVPCSTSEFEALENAWGSYLSWPEKQKALPDYEEKLDDMNTLADTEEYGDDANLPF